ncbi:unnamed protein product [Clonostachys byssicola]|uniref:Uncharacterized protein n=1 Tax=Clonostachys byssicola TaxID=160290 RepID=A0A9N9Y6D3_9HYPO|nr:unnamed protein product [Clonostachys byssicola]
MMPASRVSRASTMPVDIGSEASADSKSKMPGSLVSRASTMPVNAVSKAWWWSKWDPDKRWGTLNKYKLAAQPQEGYCFSKYLGHDANHGPYRLDNLDTILYVPEAVPDEYQISVSGLGVLSESDAMGPWPGPPATREFRFQKLENHQVDLTSDDLNRMADHPPVKRILGRHLGRRNVYVITGMKIVDGLEVSDGFEFYRKFEGRVIFSYQMHVVHNGCQSLRQRIMEKP